MCPATISPAKSPFLCPLIALSLEICESGLTKAAVVNGQFQLIFRSEDRATAGWHVGEMHRIVVLQ